MALPAKIKHLNFFNEGQTYIGQSESFTRPKLARKFEAFRGGGMHGAVHIDHGLEDDALDVEWVVGGYAAQVIKQMGIAEAGGVMLRFVGSVQRDDTAAVSALEIVVRGRHAEIDTGEYKTGEDSNKTITTKCVYYKETLDNEVLVEIDLLNGIELVGGVDRMAEHRRAIGM